MVDQKDANELSCEKMGVITLKVFIYTEAKNSFTRAQTSCFQFTVDRDLNIQSISSFSLQPSKIFLFRSIRDIFNSIKSVAMEAFHDPEDADDMDIGEMTFGSYLYATGQLFWLACSGLALLAAVSGIRKLLYPWLAAMLFAHVTTASTLVELMQGAWLGEWVWQPIFVWVATVLFGMAAIYLAYKRIKEDSQE